MLRPLRSGDERLVGGADDHLLGLIGHSTGERSVILSEHVVGEDLPAGDEEVSLQVIGDLIRPGRDPWYETWCSVGSDWPSRLQSIPESWRLNAQSSRNRPRYLTVPVSGSKRTSTRVSGAIATL